MKKQERQEKWFVYPQTQHLDAPQSMELLAVHVNVEEKIDGDLVAFRTHEDQLEIYPPLALEFEPIVSHLQANQYQLNPEYVYFIELLAEAQGTILTYSRAPRGGAILVDVRTPEGWLDHEQKFQVAEALGLECAPLLYQGYLTSADTLVRLSQQESLLGGVMEGIIIKPVNLASGAKTRFGKLVNAEYVARKVFSRAEAHQLEQASGPQVGALLRRALGSQLDGELPPSRRGVEEFPMDGDTLPDSDL